MPHSSSIPRTPSQTAFDRVCDIYDSVSDVAKGDKRATAVLVDYFKSQPEDARLAKGQALVARAHQLPEPAQRVAHAAVHSVSAGLTRTTQACAQARKLIDKLCIERHVRRVQEELERGFAYHGTSLRQAAAAATPPVNADLMASLRDSSVLDEAVLEVVARVPADKLNAYVAAYTDEISRLSDRMHTLRSDLARVCVTVGPGAQGLRLTQQEQEGYARLLAWTATVDPRFHQRLERLDSIPDEVRAQVPPEQLEAFMALCKRAALTEVRKAFKPADMDKLQAFRAAPLWQELEPLSRTLETLGNLAIMHIQAPLTGLLMELAMRSGRAAAADGRPALAFDDPSAQPLDRADNMGAQPFFGLQSDEV